MIVLLAPLLGLMAGALLVFLGTVAFDDLVTGITSNLVGSSLAGGATAMAAVVRKQTGRQPPWEPKQSVIWRPGRDASSSTHAAGLRRHVSLKATLLFLPLVLGPLVAVPGFFVAGRDIKCYRETPFVAITSPAGRTETAALQIRGTYSGMCRHDIWVFVQSHDAPQFHPQPGPAVRLGDGTWLTTVHLGSGSGEKQEETFEIIATSASREASELLVDYLEDATTSGDFRGLPLLPEGVEVQDQITVTLNTRRSAAADDDGEERASLIRFAPADNRPANGHCRDESRRSASKEE